MLKFSIKHINKKSQIKILTISLIFQWELGFVPSTYRFLEAFGKTTSHPYIKSVILTWHPSLLVGVSPKAKSSKSYSSSTGGVNLSKICLGKMTWHVEHARLA